MTNELRIEHAGGTTSRLDAERHVEWTRDLDEQGRARAVVKKEDWANVESTLDEQNDKLYIDIDGTTEFGGRFEDVETTVSNATVLLSSPETDAADAEPTGGNLVYLNVNDSTIVSDQLSNVGTLSAGTVNTVEASVSYTASYGSRSKVVRDMREVSGAEIRYNSDWTLDYVSQLGSDLSGSVTIGPAEQNIGEDFDKTIDVREQVTHVLALGAQQGPNQIQATATASSYSASDRQIWRRYENKEAIQQSRLQDIADTLVAEYDGSVRALEVETVVYDEDLSIGDTVTVDYPAEGINSETLRVVTLTTAYSPKGGRHQVVTLSNRTLTRPQNIDAKRGDDLQRFNRGHEGFLDRNTQTSGWNPAGDGIEQELVVPNWPDDIESELTVDLIVQGRAWRSPVTATGHTHDVSVTHPSHSHDVSTTSSSTAGQRQSNTLTTGFSGLSTVTASEDIPPKAENRGLFISVDCNPDTESVTRLEIRDTTEGQQLYDVSISGSHSRYIFKAAIDSEHVNRIGNTIQVTMTLSKSDSGTLDVATVGEDQHSHSVSDTSTTALGTTETATSDSKTDFSPQIIDTFDGNSYYPSDVEIRVNGTLVTTVPGNNNAEWQETVDLTGQLTAGQNRITALPTSTRGEVNVTFSTELFRRGKQENTL